jgi:hypothetical protein
VELPTASGVPPGKAQIVKSMRMVNGNATTAATVNVYLNSGTENLASPKDLSLGPGQMYVDDSEIALEEGHKLKLVVTGAGPVHFAVSGIERDA